MSPLVALAKAGVRFWVVAGLRERYLWIDAEPPILLLDVQLSDDEGEEAARWALAKLGPSVSPATESALRSGDGVA